MDQSRPARLIAICLCAILSANAFSDDLDIGFYASAGINPTPSFGDPGLDKVFEIYENAHPSLSDPLDRIRGMLGLTLNGGTMFTLNPDLFWCDVTMGWSGLLGFTSASDGTHTRDFQLGLSTFQAAFAVLLAIVPERVYLGPSIGMQAGDLLGKTRYDSGPWQDSDGPVMGWDIGVKAWALIPGLPFILSVRPWWRMMDGIYGYASINDLINPDYPDNIFESHLKSFGIQVEAMLRFL